MRMIIKVTIEEGEKEEENVVITNFGLDGYNFQVDNHDEDKIYFLLDDKVYTHKIEEKKEEGGFTNFFNKGFGFTAKEDENEDENSLFGSIEFFRSKSKINFLKFDSNMEFFYCDDQKVIKKYRYDNKEVVMVYDDVLCFSKQILLNEKNSFFFR
jgi:hypothetical protein